MILSPTAAVGVVAMAQWQNGENRILGCINISKYVCIFICTHQNHMYKCIMQIDNIFSIEISKAIGRTIK